MIDEEDNVEQEHNQEVIADINSSNIEQIM